MSIKRQKHAKSIALPVIALTSLLVLSACTTTSEKENTEAAQNAQPPVVVQVEPTKTATMTTILHQLQIQTASTSTQSTLIHLDDQPIIEVTLKDGSFRFGSAKLNPKKREGLTPVLNILNQYPNTTVHIEGHTDSIGSKALNQSLSQKRADSVAAYLVQNGITQERIQTFGYGEERPIADNTKANGRQENRRVVFLIRHP